MEGVVAAVEVLRANERPRSNRGLLLIRLLILLLLLLLLLLLVRHWHTANRITFLGSPDGPRSHNEPPLPPPRVGRVGLRVAEQGGVFSDYGESRELWSSSGDDFRRVFPRLSVYWNF